MIIGYIKGQSLKIVQPVIAADTINYITANFSFKTADWSGLTKYAHFRQGETVYDVPLTEDCIRKEDGLNLGAGIWQIYLHGNEFVDGEVVERATTEIAEITVKPTGVLNGEPFPSAVPSISEQILASIGDMSELETEAKDTLVAAINEAAESGGGGGGSGKIWLPTVTADGDISWEKSSTDIAPTPRNIKGDRGERGLQGEPGTPGQDGRDGQDGQDGHSPIITAAKSGKVTTVYSDGVSIATINDGADGEDGADGAPGQNGQDGADGHSPVITAEKSGTVTTVYSDGVEIAEINDGANGQNGADGQDGYTPVRGTDYWTEEDQASIVNDVLAALPTWTGGSY